MSSFCSHLFVFFLFFFKDFDDCASEGTHGCSSICVNIPGSYMCDCPLGYQLIWGKDCHSKLLYCISLL